MQNHLRYESPEAWAVGEHLPEDWTKHPDAHQRGVWFQQLAELKQHLWARHIATLSMEEQKEFETGTHPSVRHEFRDRALPYAEALKDELSRRGYASEVTLVFYHLDRIVLRAVLDRTPVRRLLGVPWLFRGFEIKYLFPDTETKAAQPARPDNVG